MCYFVVRPWLGVGQAQPRAIHITSSHCWDNRYKWRRYGHRPDSTKSTFKTYFQDETKLCDWWAGSVFCDRSNRHFQKTEWVLLPDMPKRPIFTHPWRFRGLTAFPSNPTFLEGSTPPPWNSWMACPWFQRQASDWRWAGEAARQNFASSLSCSGQGVLIPRRLDSGCFRKHWPSTSCARQSFVPRRCAPTVWKLRIGWTSVGAICLDGQLDKCQRCLVAQWSFG